MILVPLCVEFVSTFVGEDAFVNKGFLGCGLAKPHTLAGMPIGGGEVILGLSQGDKEQADVDLEISKERGVKKPPCLGALGFGGFVTRWLEWIGAGGGEQIRVTGDGQIEGDCTRELGSEDGKGRATLLCKVVLWGSWKWGSPPVFECGAFLWLVAHPLLLKLLLLLLLPFKLV